MPDDQWKEYQAQIERIRSGGFPPEARAASAEKPPVSEGSFWPKTWQEALPLLVWGVLIFAFGFEGVSSLIHGEWWQALFGFGGMVGLTAMLIHWARIQKFNDARWLVAASMVALIVVALSPYVEQRRSPFASWFQSSTPPTVIHDPPTPDDIAQTTAPLKRQLEEANKGLQNTRDIILGLQGELADVTRQRNDLKRQLDALPQAQQSPTRFQPYSLTEDQIHTLANAFFEVKNILPSSIEVQRMLNDNLSQELSISIAKAFDLASIQPIYNWSRPSTPKDLGVRIRVGNIQAIPDGAKKVADALRIVGIESNFETLAEEAPGNFIIFVGPKP